MDPMAGGADPNAMPADPGMEDPNAAAPMSDLNAGGAPMDDPNAIPADGEYVPMADENGEDDSTMDIINQLSPADREAVRAYAESMLSRDETSTGEEGLEPAEPAAQEPGVMMEISKGRLIKAQKRINEMFGDMIAKKDEDERDRVQRRVSMKKNWTKSPFGNPFNGKMRF